MEIINKNFDVYKSYLARLVSIPSVLSDDEKPFGKHITEALDEILLISKELGFRTFKHQDNLYGYAEIGEGDPLFGVLGHVDVVGAGALDAWDSDPFVLNERDGKLYGRGTSDDKGPTLASMFALKLLLDEGHELKGRVRFIFGTDEESLWRCMDAYKENEEIPSLGFTPDADFPVVNLEKGILQMHLKGPILEQKYIVGGDSMNAVASHAHSKLRLGLIEALNELNLNHEIKEDVVNVFGKSAHASTPHEGINAIYKLSKALKHANLASDAENFVVHLYEEKPLNIFEDKMSGLISFNVGKAYVEDHLQILTLDLRYPVSFKKEEIIDKVKEIANKYNLDAIEYTSLPSIYVDENHELMKAFMNAYQEVTGDYESKPLKMGGGTYARAMDNILAFGALLPNRVAVAHQANEFIDIEDMKVAIKVYMKAFSNLV